MKTAIFTICSRNYLAYALTLQKSLESAEPGVPFYIYLADEAPAPGTAPEGNIVPARELGLPDLMDMAFRYNVVEFNTAIKADCFLDLLNRRGFDAAIYIDPDIRLYAPLTDVHAALEGGASAVLTPHLLKPPPEGAHPGDLEILSSGVFNLGFGAFARTEESLAFLRWWAGKLHTSCYSAPHQGLFVDQRFVDMAPAFIERLSILRHWGYNVAYWNIANRQVERGDEGIRVNGAPLVFFHFSGVDPGKPDVFSKHLGAHAREADETVFSLVHAYREELVANGQAQWAGVPYAFGTFRDGSRILPPMRRRPPEKGGAEDWFAAPDAGYWNAPDPRVDQKKGMTLTRLMMGFWEMRPDLQTAFPLGTAAGRRGLHAWFHRHGAKEYGISSDWLQGVRLSWFAT